jgi:hypothetical protein
MRSLRKLAGRIPKSVRFTIFATLGLVVALIGGGIYLFITAISFAVFGGRILIYPGLLAGMFTGYSLHFFKHNLRVPANAVFFIITISAGLIVFLSRWWVEATIRSDAGLIRYLLEYAQVKSEIFFGDAHHRGDVDSSPFFFWIFFLLEGFLTTYVPARVANDGFLVP